MRTFILLIAVIALAGCSRINRAFDFSVKPSADLPEQNIRSSFIYLNATIDESFKNCGIKVTPSYVNVGERPDDGTGDLLVVALNKVDADIEFMAKHCRAAP